jgi:MerR family transcriptional regulator, copper efflux regulator
MKSSGRSIGDVAAQFGVATSVLRHWEDVGLIDPARDSGGRRSYDDDDIVRLAVIARSKAAGMQLDQISVILDREADDRRRILEEHIASIAERIAEMELWKHLTEHALECRRADISECPNFRNGIADLLAGAPMWQAPRPGHVHQHAVS